MVFGKFSSLGLAEYICEVVILFGKLVRSTELVVVEQPMTLGREILSWKHCEPLSLYAHEYAAALISVTWGV